MMIVEYYYYYYYYYYILLLLHTTTTTITRYSKLKSESSLPANPHKHPEPSANTQGLICRHIYDAAD